MSYERELCKFRSTYEVVWKSLTILMMEKTYGFEMNFLPKPAMIYFLSFRKGSANPMDSRYLFLLKRLISFGIHRSIKLRAMKINLWRKSMRRYSKNIPFAFQACLWEIFFLGSLFLYLFLLLSVIKSSNDQIISIW
jgi:hypothetical protein